MNNSVSSPRPTRIGADFLNFLTDSWNSGKRKVMPAHRNSLSSRVLECRLVSELSPDHLVKPSSEIRFRAVQLPSLSGTPASDAVDSEPRESACFELKQVEMSAPPRLNFSDASLPVNQFTEHSQPSQSVNSSSHANSQQEGSSYSGPAFMGHVFSLTNPSRSAILGLCIPSSVQNDPHPLVKLLLEPAFRLVGRGFVDFVNAAKEEVKNPKIRFFFNNEEAQLFERVLHCLNPELEPCAVDPFPLESAYNLFKTKPSLFKFVPDMVQVQIAKELLRKRKGKKAADSFKGVPVFTASNLTIAMATQQGIKWFTPYFFSKAQLDALMGTSVDHFYKELLMSRRTSRYNQVTGGAEGLGDGPDEDGSELIDPSDVQDFMQEIGESSQSGSMAVQSALVKIVQLASQECVDSVILGSRWGRKLAGLQPNIPVLVDSFGRRAALAEARAASEANSSSRVGVRLNRGGKIGPDDFGFSLDTPDFSTADSEQEGCSLNEGSDCPESASHSHERGIGLRIKKALKLPMEWVEKTVNDFDFFGDVGKVDGGEDAEELGEARHKSGGKEGRKASGLEPWQVLQPKLTMLGVAVQGPAGSFSDSQLKEVMITAARELEQMEVSNQAMADRGPLFIANLENPYAPASTNQWEADDGE